MANCEASLTKLKNLIAPLYEKLQDEKYESLNDKKQFEFLLTEIDNIAVYVKNHEAKFTAYGTWQGTQPGNDWDKISVHKNKIETRFA